MNNDLFVSIALTMVAVTAAAVALKNILIVTVFVVNACSQGRSYLTLCKKTQPSKTTYTTAQNRHITDKPPPGKRRIKVFKID